MRQAQKTAATRQALLAATLDELEASGEGGLRVDRVATRAQVNKSLIYRHFKDREGLIAAAMSSQVEVVLAVSSSARLRRLLQTLFEGPYGSPQGSVQRAMSLLMPILIARRAEWVDTIDPDAELATEVFNLMFGATAAAPKPRFRLVSRSRLASRSRLSST